jgi:hypothetical protein
MKKITKFHLSVVFHTIHSINHLIKPDRVGDLSRESILQSIREHDLSILKDDTIVGLFNDKKFCKECIATCVMETRLVIASIINKHS